MACPFEDWCLLALQFQGPQRDQAPIRYFIPEGRTLCEFWDFKVGLASVSMSDGGIMDGP